MGDRWIQPGKPGKPLQLDERSVADNARDESVTTRTRRAVRVRSKWNGLGSGRPGDFARGWGCVHGSCFSQTFPHAGGQTHQRLGGIEAGDLGHAAKGATTGTGTIRARPVVVVVARTGWTDRFGRCSGCLVEVAILATDVMVGDVLLSLRRVFLASMRGGQGVAEGAGADECRKRQEGNQT